MAAPLAPAVIDAIVTRTAAGESYGAIAEALGVSRNAVGGVVFRLRKAGDPRLPQAGPGPAQTKADQRDRLADAWAAGAVNLQVAAKRAALTITQAKDRWREICTSLGAQAR